MTKILSTLLVALALSSPALADKSVPAKKGRAAATASETAPAPAAAPTPRAWTEEPTTFLGIELGAPIASQSAVKKCPMVRASYGGESLDWAEMKRSEPFCYANPPFYTEFWNKPLLGFAYELMFRTLDDGGLHALVLTFPRTNLAQMKDLLLSKYGQPTSTSSLEYQNGFAAKVDGATYEWKGTKLTITFMEVGGKLSQSALLVGTNDYFERTAQKAADNKGKFKDNL